MMCRTCGAPGARLYMTGPQCPLHTPAATAGRPEDHPDPKLTMTALQAAAGMVVGFSRADTAAIDRKAIESGRRRGGRLNYLRTQRALAEAQSQNMGRR